MTSDELRDACEKFCEYLKANGRRPIALVLEVCDDHANTEELVFRGLQEVVDAACLRVVCHNLGYSVKPR